MVFRPPIPDAVGQRGCRLHCSKFVDTFFSELLRGAEEIEVPSLEVFKGRDAPSESGLGFIRVGIFLAKLINPLFNQQDKCG